MILFFTTFFLFFLTILTLKISMKFFKKSFFIDHPNTRTNHSKPTPKGAGLILLPIILFSSILTFSFLNNLTEDWIIFFLSAFILTCISLIDDIFNLSSKLRLLVQFFCVTFSIMAMNSDLITFLGSLNLFDSYNYFSIFYYSSFFFLTIFWIWIINLFNFMDGMDGITSVQVCSLAVAINLLCILEQLNTNFQYFSLILFSVFLSFLYFNKPPAKIFLGDVGSIPIGYFSGLILVKCMLSFNLIIPILIVLMYYFLDTGLTLMTRMLKRKDIFQAHSEHFYQKAIRAGGSHRTVLNKIIFLNFLLILLSLISLIYPYICLIVSIIITSIFLFHFRESSIDE